ncbi:hypothetical protein HUG15_03980 [Salicibibacter cibarius]|uniref:DUF1648 domain-containing protein n=1 Tax=Salicibibacter cibarius TaxID=2743000 RepID=A0A7T6Z0S1_9BACI|nr:hypothetical protein [Salicibibacter cibarius]QQK74845.1 hypothetical protein HUG15_03980 [Salicibibacter cibarius]
MPMITFFDRSDRFLIPFLLLMVVGTAFVYPLLPDSVAIQFNPATSEASSIVHKSFGIWGSMGLMAILLLICNASKFMPPIRPLFDDGAPSVQQIEAANTSKAILIRIKSAIIVAVATLHVGIILFNLDILPYPIFSLLTIGFVVLILLYMARVLVIFNPPVNLWEEEQPAEVKKVANRYIAIGLMVMAASIAGMRFINSTEWVLIWVLFTTIFAPLALIVFGIVKAKKKWEEIETEAG